MGVGDGQKGLACCSSWGLKELDTTERLNWTELNYVPGIFPGCRDTTENKTYNMSILLDFKILGKNINYLHLGRLSINIYQENKKFRKTGLWVYFFSHFSLLKYCLFMNTQLKYQASYFSSSAATAKSLQSCPTRCDPIDGSPPGSPVPGILQARTLEWVAISFSNAWKWKVKVKFLSHVWFLATPWTAAYQALPSMGFSRQEYWSGMPLPSPYGRSICIEIESCL